MSERLLDSVVLSGTSVTLRKLAMGLFLCSGGLMCHTAAWHFQIGEHKPVSVLRS